jgi:2-dehydropantoate 2-reductase
MAPRIGFMGAGAVGSYIGAFLTREGHDVTLIDMWPEHVETLKARGIRVSGSQGEFTVPVRAMHLTEVVNLEAPFDIAFVAVKSYDTEWATHFIKRHLTPTGFIVCSQNGMNDETIARIVGYDRVVPLVMSGISVGLMEPGHVTRGGVVGREHGHDVFRAGEFGGQQSPRTRALVEMLSCIDGSFVTSNIWGERWSKLATNCMGNTLAAMSGTAAGDLAKMTPRFAVLRDEVAHELVLIGTALGVSIEPISGKTQSEWLDFKPDLAAASSSAPVQASASPLGGDGGPSYPSSWPTSTLQDIIKGRRSEVDYLNGYVSQRGRDVGIATPVNDAIVRVLKQVDNHELPADPTNVDRVWELVYGRQPIATSISV